MDPTLLAAIIGAVATFLAAFLSPYFGHMIEKRKKAKQVAKALVPNKSNRKIVTDGKPSKRLSIAKFEEVVRWGWDGEILMKQIFNLDYANFSNLNQEREGSINQWAEIFMNYPKIWSILIAPPNKVIGYWCFLPLKKEYFQKAQEGTLQDSHIENYMFDDIDLPGTYNLYFDTICIETEYRRIGFRLLWDAFILEISDLAKNSVFFEEICVNAYTSKGIGLCVSAGLRRIGNHHDHGEIFCGKMSEIILGNLFQNYPTLVKLYQRKGKSVQRKPGKLSLYSY